MSKVYDFDAFWKEAGLAKQEGPKMRVFGEEVTLPPFLPARIVLQIMSFSEEERPADATLSMGEVYKQACAFFTKERVEAWMDQGLTLPQLDAMVAQAIQLYSKRNDGEGNETPPETGETTKPKQSRSSKTGT